MQPGTIVLTGCAGFIGFKVAESLLGAGHTVVGIVEVIDADDVRLKYWRLDQITHHERFHLHNEDITAREGRANA